MGRVALLADFLAERWPSMDLVADMYAASLPRAFASAGPRMEIDLLRPELKRRTSRLHPAGWNFDRLINRLFDYPLYARARRREYDLLHIVDHSYSQLVHALPAARTVVTCHDLDTFRCLWEPGHAGRGPLFLAMTRRILAGLRKAAHVCCDSVATHDELLARALVPAQRATVVPLGVRPEFLREPGPEASAKVAGLLRAPGLDDTQSIDVLHIGSTIARKRIDLLLEIFASLRNAEPRLRLLRVGGPFTGSQQAQVERLELADSILTLPFLSVEELGAVYRHAALVFLPSDAEGFGLPVVEALACGTPVIASNLPVLREVGGAAADYAPIGDIPAWRALALALLDERRRKPCAWRERRERCRNQAAKFTWEETARKTVAIYQQVLAEAGLSTKA